LATELRLILASASPARLATLRSAGVEPEVILSDVDEDVFSATDVPGLVAELARAKAAAVFERLDGTDDVVVLGCDSLLEFDGEPMGKPVDAAQARERWLRMRGGTGHLHTGHQVIARLAGEQVSTAAVATTEVSFAELSEDEVDAYIATSEPLWVAGAFTIDGLGGAYVTGISGDPHNVVGISLPLLRRMLAGLGVPWHSLWAPGAR
jgi:septum formation protein